MAIIVTEPVQLHNPVLEVISHRLSSTTTKLSQFEEYMYCSWIQLQELYLALLWEVSLTCSIALYGHNYSGPAWAQDSIALDNVCMYMCVCMRVSGGSRKWEGGSKWQRAEQATENLGLSTPISSHITHFLAKAIYSSFHLWYNQQQDTN